MAVRHRRQRHDRQEVRLLADDLIGTAGPEKLIAALEDGYDDEKHGRVHVHFHTFGGVAATSDRIRGFRSR